MDVKIGFDKTSAPSELAQVPLYNSLNGQPLLDAQGSVLVAEATQFLETALTSDAATSVSMLDAAASTQAWRIQIETWSYLSASQEFVLTTKTAQPPLTPGSQVTITDTTPAPYNQSYAVVSQSANLKQLTVKIPSTFTYASVTVSITQIVHDVSLSQAQITVLADVAPQISVGDVFAGTLAGCWPQSLNGTHTCIKQSDTQFQVLLSNQQDYRGAPQSGSLVGSFSVNTSVKVVEQFPELSAVSTTLLGIPREETQLGLFADVSSYGLDRDQWETYFFSNDNEEPAEWRTRQNRFWGAHFSERLAEYTNESSLALEIYPPAYGFPFNQSYEPDGLYNQSAFDKFLKFMDMGNKLYTYLDQFITCVPEDTACEILKRDFLNLFLNPDVVRMTALDNPLSTFELGASVTIEQAFAAIDTWTDTWRLMRDEDTAPVIPGTNTKVLPEWVNNYVLSQAGYQFSGTEPGYDRPGRNYLSVLQSKKAFRYQPGRISGFTFGVKADTALNSTNVVAEWGCVNDTDQYVFQLIAGRLRIVRRSLVQLTQQAMQLSGITNQAQRRSRNLFDNKIYWESVVPQDAWTGDTLTGLGGSQNLSNYRLEVDKVTMMKIEFGWYGAIGARFYAYVPVGNGEARWVVLTTIVIENTMGKPCLVDPYFKFSYLLAVNDTKAITKPQFVYKYGSSYYIDGGDSGTLRPVSVSSLPKMININTNTGLIALTPRTAFTSASALPGESPIIQNKKISLLSDLVSTSSGLVKLEIRKCVGCPEFAHTYLPHLQSDICGYLSDDPEGPDALTNVNVTTSRSQITLESGSWTESDVGAKLVAAGVWNMYLADTSGNLVGYALESSPRGWQLKSRTVPLNVFLNNTTQPLPNQLQVRVNRFLAVAVSPRALTGDLIELRFLNPRPREPGVGFGHFADFAVGVTYWKPVQYQSQSVVDHYELTQWVILQSGAQIRMDTQIPVQDPDNLIQVDDAVTYHAVTSTLNDLQDGVTYYVAQVVTEADQKYISLKADPTPLSPVIELDDTNTDAHVFEVVVRKNRLSITDSWNMQWHAHTILRDAQTGLERGEGQTGVDSLRMDYRLPRPDGFNTGLCSKVTVERMSTQVVTSVRYTTQINEGLVGFFVYKDQVDWLSGLDTEGIKLGTLQVMHEGQLFSTHAQYVDKGVASVNVDQQSINRYWARLNYAPTWISSVTGAPDLTTSPFSVLLSVMQVREPPTSTGLPRQVFSRLESEVNQTYHAVCHLRDRSRVNNLEIYEKTITSAESINPSWWLQTGHGAQATAQVSGGALVAVMITPGQSGKNYLRPPLITFTGGGGSNATAWSEIDSEGRLVKIEIQNPGSGYTSAPQVQITDPGLTHVLSNGISNPILSNLTSPPPTYLDTGRLNSLLVDVNNSLPSRATQIVDTWYVGQNQLVRHDVSSVFAIDKQVITPGIWNNEAFFVSATNLDDAQSVDVQTSVNIVEE